MTDAFTKAIREKAGEFNVFTGVGGWVMLLNKGEESTNDKVLDVSAVLSQESDFDYEAAGHEMSRSILKLWRSHASRDLFKCEVTSLGAVLKFGRVFTYVAFFIGATPTQNTAIAQAGLSSVKEFLKTGYHYPGLNLDLLHRARIRKADTRTN